MSSEVDPKLNNDTSIDGAVGLRQSIVVSRADYFVYSFFIRDGSPIMYASCCECYCV